MWSYAWAERLGEVDAVLVLDGTGFLTEGNRSGEFGDSGRARRGGLSTVGRAGSWAVRPRADGCWW
ncbi:hypothetical protein GCM10027028_44520 [Streptomyces sundarbansensis]